MIVAPIYAAREKEDKSISSEILVETIKNSKAVFMPSFEEIKQYLKKRANENNVIITMGAGDVYKIAEALVQKR